MSFVLIACTFTPFALPRLLHTERMQTYEYKHQASAKHKCIEELFTCIIITMGWKLLIFPRFVSNLLSRLWCLLLADVWTLLPPGSAFPPATKSREPTGLTKLPSEVGESLETGLRWAHALPGCREATRKVVSDR